MKLSVVADSHYKYLQWHKGLSAELKQTEIYAVLLFLCASSIQMPKRAPVIINHYSNTTDYLHCSNRLISLLSYVFV